MTSRIVETSVSTIRREAVSPRVVINWNIDNTGSIEFWVSQAIETDGVLTGIELDNRREMSPLRVDIGDILQRTFNVPLPSGGTYPVPAMLVMGAIKEAFDVLYSEKIEEMEAAEAALNATPTPTPSASETPAPTPEPTPTPSGE